MSKKVFIMMALLASLTGCYSVPEEDEFCVIPTVNNPSVTRQKAQGPIPGMNY